VWIVLGVQSRAMRRVCLSVVGVGSDILVVGELVWNRGIDVRLIFFWIYVGDNDDRWKNIYSRFATWL
jgi:hypothetical protein